MSEIDQVSMRNTIGLTAEGRGAMEQVMSAGWFSTNGDAFKFGVAFALALSLQPTPDPAAFSTIWNKGTLDPEDHLATLVGLLSPCDDPYDRIRRLGDAGLREIVKRNLHFGLPSEILDVLND